ncbi:MAG: hypothetical protein ACMG6H_03355, partial [Acidobacteriota bacterium]
VGYQSEIREDARHHNSAIAAAARGRRDSINAERRRIILAWAAARMVPQVALAQDKIRRIVSLGIAQADVAPPNLESLRAGLRADEVIQRPTGAFSFEPQPQVCCWLLSPAGRRRPPAARAA